MQHAVLRLSGGADDPTFESGGNGAVEEILDNIEDPFTAAGFLDFDGEVPISGTVPQPQPEPDSDDD